jgi:hypothetical protein
MSQGIFKSRHKGGIGAVPDGGMLPFTPTAFPICDEICAKNCGPQPAPTESGTGVAVWSVCNDQCQASCNDPEGNKVWIENYKKQLADEYAKNAANNAECMAIQDRLSKTSFWDDPLGVIRDEISDTACGLWVTGGTNALVAGNGGDGASVSTTPSPDTASSTTTTTIAIDGGSPTIGAPDGSYSPPVSAQPATTAPPAAPAAAPLVPQGMSTAEKVGIVALVGIGAYLLFRKK